MLGDCRIFCLILTVGCVASSTAPPSVATTPPVTTTHRPTGECRLHAADEHLPLTIATYIDEGVNLVKYEITFADYDVNPLDVNVTHAYNAHQWHRVFNRHGLVLIALTFNFDVLSLSLLQFGVVNLDVELADQPKGCFGAQEENVKIALVKNLLLHDFKKDNKSVTTMGEQDFVCHQVLEVDDDDDVRFSDQCCRIHAETGDVHCHIEGPIPTINILYYLLIGIKIAFLFYGPLALQSWIYQEPPKRPTYIVPLSDDIEADVNRYKSNKYIPRRKLRTDLPQNQRMTFEKLHIKVDNHSLMTEKSVPVGLFRFLIDNFLKCKITRTEPFSSCCSQSIMGSWSRYFLCIPLRRNEPKCNTACKKCCSWRHIFVFIGSVLSLGFVSLPFIFRISIYYEYEHVETANRRAAVEALGHELSQSHNVFQTLNPTDGVLIFGYICYFASFLILAILGKFCQEELISVVKPVMEDLQEVSYIEAIRMVFAHLILPFEKFGIFGLLIGLVYWPIALPVCIVALVCYCIPTFYLTGRFLIHHRPKCLDVGAQPQPLENMDDPEQCDKVKHSLTFGAKSIDTMLKLNNISPADPDPELQDILPDNPFHHEEDTSRLKECLCENVVPILIGIVCIINMYALVVMYAEVLGFLAEIIILTLMGAIINASVAHKYIMLAFWILMYTVNCYNNVYENYFKLNQKLFGYMKSKLDSQVMAVTLQKATMQKNTAFKYFNRIEIREMCEKYPDFLSNAIHSTPADILVENKKGKLFWNVKSLVLFVNKNDVAHIPRKLFFSICEEELEGCPGPVYKSLAHATKNLLYMVVFLMFVFLIIMAYGSVYAVSSTNQLLLTLAGGFLPSIIRFVIQPNIKINIDLNTYTFHGRIQQILYEFTQKWPVAVLNGEYSGENVRGFSPESGFVTVEDEVSGEGESERLMHTDHQGGVGLYTVVDGDSGKSDASSHMHDD